jgi:hypothetical protein
LAASKKLFDAAFPVEITGDDSSGQVKNLSDLIRENSQAR